MATRGAFVGLVPPKQSSKSLQIQIRSTMKQHYLFKFQRMSSPTALM